MHTGAGKGTGPPGQGKRRPGEGGTVGWGVPWREEPLCEKSQRMR
jgi:hypothetical protein